MAELREVAKIIRFGSVIPISGSDFVREVSQAPPDVWVVVILYKEGYVSEVKRIYGSILLNQIYCR